MADSQDTSFARLASLAIHDLRTPLATIYGFARTLDSAALPDEKQARYVEMIIAAARQMTGLLEEIGLAARIVGERYDAARVEVDTLELARTAVPSADGSGTTIETDPEALGRALASFVDCARKHGGGRDVALHVDGATFVVEPVTEGAAPVLTGEELKDLGAAVAQLTVRALGGTAEVADGRLTVRL
jgi:signal transduction histidine kinase